MADKTPRTLFPYKIEAHPIRGEKKPRFVYKISGKDYYGSLMDVHKYIEALMKKSRFNGTFGYRGDITNHGIKWNDCYSLGGKFLERTQKLLSYISEMDTSTIQGIMEMKKKMKDKGYWESNVDAIPVMDEEEIKDAEEMIESDRVAFQMDYVDFCNEFGYDANKTESRDMYKYGRTIYGYNGVY